LQNYQYYCTSAEKKEQNNMKNYSLSHTDTGKSTYNAANYNIFLNVQQILFFKTHTDRQKQKYINNTYPAFRKKRKRTTGMSFSRSYATKMPNARSSFDPTRSPVYKVILQQFNNFVR
jgi:hypothetical protein